MSINSSMLGYGLYRLDETGSSPTGRPTKHYIKIDTIGVALSQKDQFVDSRELQYKLTTLSGVSPSKNVEAGMMLVEGSDTPQILDKLTGYKITSVNLLGRLAQFSLEKCEV